jgi:HK97 family phage major capsid protein
VAGGRIRNVADFTAANVALGIGGAYGMLETDKPLTMVANRQTWGRMATVTDADGRAVFTANGQQVTAGALGAFNVVVSQEVPNGNVVLGAFNDYDLVTRGGLETLFSREATVGSLNLFTDDASAVRACCDIAGKAARLESFVLIDFVPVVS